MLNGRASGQAGGQAAGQVAESERVAPPFPSGHCESGEGITAPLPTEPAEHDTTVDCEDDKRSKCIKQQAMFSTGLVGADIVYQHVAPSSTSRTMTLYRLLVVTMRT